MRLPRFLFTATFRLTGLYLFLFAISVTLLAGLVIFQVRNAVVAETRAQINSEINLLLFEYREDGLDELLEETEERIEKNRAQLRLLYMVQSPSGQVIFDPVDAVVPPLGWRQIAGADTQFFFTELDNGYILGVGKKMTGLVELQQVIGRVLLWTVLALLIIGGAGGFILSRRALAKIETINRTARAIGEGHLSRRIPWQRTGDEFDHLTRTLNQMLERIEQLVNNVRHVSTGIAHDLRTPLARLRIRLEDLTRADSPQELTEAIAPAIADVDEILATFAALLRLAEVEAGVLRRGFQKLDLTLLLRQIADAYEPLVEGGGSRLEVMSLAAAEFCGDRDLLQQMVANLIENALQHAGPCTVTLSLSAGPEGLVLSVADNGRGVAALDLDRVVKPFERAPHSGGSGMGLALVAAIARLHQGELQLLDNAPGLICRVKFATFNG